MVREALTLQRLGTLEPREAAAYFIARRAEGLTASDQQLLADWLAQDEVHRRMFDSTDHAWRSFEKADEDEILTAMRAHALASGARVAKSWRPAAAAAAVLILAFGALIFIPGLNPWAPESATIGAISESTMQYTSARGETKELNLPDGSHMTLDADSSAVGRFSADHRSIQLQRGRAYFEIATDRTRPFVAKAADRSIVVVGTRFDVNLTTDGLTVTLLEGHVDVSSADPARTRVTLQPGQQYVERLGEATIRDVGAAGDNVIAWRTGLIFFDDQPLSEAAAIMNRYSREQIVIGNPEVAALKVSGQFRAGDAQRFATTLAELHPIRSVRRGDQIELAPR